MIVTGYVLIVLITFYLLAKVVEDYFVGSLELISARLRMSSDAAGATLMAVGSSAPVLFVVLFAVLHPGGNHEALGIGSIVGSALFNLLAITGTAAIVHRALLAWQPMVRDLLFYGLSIILLLFVFRDGKIELLDVAMFIGLYIIYVLVVINWRRMTDYIDPNEEITVQEVSNDTKYHFIAIMQRPINYVIDKLFPPKKYFYFIFLISGALIAGLSWVLVESAVQIAALLNISEALIGLTVLAVGTSVPNLFSSVVRSKQGRGGIAVDNALGANIFDILIGLGLPFLILIIISGGTVIIEAENLLRSVEFLLASVGIVFLVFLIAGWQIGKKFAVFLLLLYAAYLVWALLNVQ